MNKLESVYMILSTDNKTGEERWYLSGRNGTPFTSTSISTARGVLTRCNNNSWATYRIVKIRDVQEVI